MRLTEIENKHFAHFIWNKFCFSLLLLLLCLFLFCLCDCISVCCLCVCVGGGGGSVCLSSQLDFFLLILSNGMLNKCSLQNRHSAVWFFFFKEVAQNWVEPYLLLCQQLVNYSTTFISTAAHIHRDREEETGSQRRDKYPRVQLFSSWR